jgi:hypothetical protein
MIMHPRKTVLNNNEYKTICAFIHAMITVGDEWEAVQLLDEFGIFEDRSGNENVEEVKDTAYQIGYAAGYYQGRDDMYSELSETGSIW